MKKLVIAVLFVAGTLSISAQTGTKQSKKSKSTTSTTTTDTTTMKTRGLDKGSEQGRTMKNKNRSTRSGGTKETGHGHMHNDSTRH